MTHPTWLLRWKSAVEDSIQIVFYFAGVATYGPRWLGLIGAGIWIVRALLLRAIWKREDKADSELVGRTITVSGSETATNNGTFTVRSWKREAGHAKR